MMNLHNSHMNTIRSLYNRALVATNININNTKLLFKKFLGFEITYGTINTQDKVKALAKEFVNKQKVK